MSTDTAVERRAPSSRRGRDGCCQPRGRPALARAHQHPRRDEGRPRPVRGASTDATSTEGIPLFSSWRAALQLLHAADPANDMAAMQAELAEAEAELDAIAEESRAAYRRWQDLDRQQTAKADEIRELKRKIRLA